MRALGFHFKLPSHHKKGPTLHKDKNEDHDTTAQAHKYVNNYKTTSAYLFKSIKPMNCRLGRMLGKISLQYNARAA